MSARVMRRRRRRTRWTAQRQYGLRCYQRRWQTPPSVVTAFYMNQTGHRIGWPCGCPVCIHPEMVATGWWHSAAFRARCVPEVGSADSVPAEGRTAAGPDDVDDRIDRWHDGPHDGTPLHEALGWSWNDYKRWVETGEFPK